MRAVGIHAHETKKLGLIPNDPSKRRLKLANFLKAVPDHAIVDPPPKLVYPMDKNDAWGDCVVGGVDHALQVIYNSFGLGYTNWSYDTLLELYRTQDPTFQPDGPSNTTGPGSPADGGMNIQEFLGECVKRGYILGFAEIDLSSEDMIKAAIYLGLAIVTGETLQVAQQSKITWDYVKGSPVWGGHCTVWPGYVDTFTDPFPTVSWGDYYQMTPSFIKNQVGEAWFIITQAHVNHPDFRKGFDLKKFADAFGVITNGATFPVAPIPKPSDNPFLTKFYQDVDGWAHARHTGPTKKVAQAIVDYLKSQGM